MSTKGWTKQEKRELQLYYYRQRLFGAVVAIIGAVFMLVSEHTWWPELASMAGFCFAVAGLYVILTKNMILVDQFFIDHREDEDYYND